MKKNKSKIFSFILLQLALIFLILLLTLISYPTINNYSQKISTRLAASSPFQLNEFTGEFRPLTDFLIKEKIIKTASVSLNIQNDNFIDITEQSDLLFIWNKYKLSDFITDATPTIKFNGGIKQRLLFDQYDLILATLTSKKYTDCHFSSLINLKARVEVLRMPCLPANENIDFNGMGGGYTLKNNILYLGLGAPETSSPTIRSLAQSMDSPYGKVLAIPVASLNTKSLNLYKFKIYSSGHRNPQGLINLNGNILEIEHGPMGGDEINLLREGGNYGWPEQSLGASYESVAYPTFAPKDKKFTEPLFSFIPSVAISDIRNCPAEYANRYAPYSCMITSSLRAGSIFFILLDLGMQKVVSVERAELGMRIREFATNSPSRIIFSVDDGVLSKGLYELKLNRFTK